jgi:hypothetical protein
LHFRGRNTQLILKELKINLLKELEMEKDRTAKQKAKHDFLISKYEATLENYKVHKFSCKWMNVHHRRYRDTSLKINFCNRCLFPIK